MGRIRTDATKLSTHEDWQDKILYGGFFLTSYHAQISKERGIKWENLSVLPNLTELLNSRYTIKLLK